MADVNMEIELDDDIYSSCIGVSNSEEYGIEINDTENQKDNNEKEEQNESKCKRMTKKIK